MSTKIILEGRLTEKPTLRTAKNGNKFLTFTVAYNDYFDKDEEGNPRADFWDVSYFAKNAAEMLEKMDKGDLVQVMGRPQIRTYVNNEGAEVKQPSINADFIGGITLLRNPNGESKNNNNRNVSQNKSKPKPSASNEEDFDVPF